MDFCIFAALLTL